MDSFLTLGLTIQFHIPWTKVNPFPLIPDGRFHWLAEPGISLCQLSFLPRLDAEIVCASPQIEAECLSTNREARKKWIVQPTNSMLQIR